MPKPPLRPHQIVVRLSDEELEKVDALADERSVNRSEAVRVMIGAYPPVGRLEAV